MGIRIVTDSTAYLSPEVISQYDISVVPLIVNFGDESFKEGEKYSNKEYYHKLKTTNLVATTSQPSSGDFFTVYKKLADEGNEIISIHISSVLSGTLASAQAASTLLPEAKITVIDSLSTANPLAWMVIEAAKAAQAGQTVEKITQQVENMKKNINLLFVVDTMEYLKRGGRVGGAQALLGTLLQIKPILHLQSGRIEVFDKVRTKQKALARLISKFDSFMSNGPTMENLKVAIIHIDAEENTGILKKELEEKYPGLQVEGGELGPVIGSHAGPGTLGIAFCKL
ncbi:MAG: DegV family protein [Clostridia bacterium]|nr:DegV family protein [Clostridia bacterium]